MVQKSRHSLRPARRRECDGGEGHGLRGRGVERGSGLIDRDVNSLNAILNATMSPGMRLADLISFHALSRFTRALGARESMTAISGVPLLVETDEGAGKEQAGDTGAILLVWRHALTVGRNDGDKGSHFHDPEEEVPHGIEELRGARTSMATSSAI